MRLRYCILARCHTEIYVLLCSINQTEDVLGVQQTIYVPFLSVQWTLLLSGWRVLPRVQFSPKKLPNKAQWEKNLAKTGHWQVDLGQSGRWEHQWKLSHCPQKHKLSTNLETELPAQTCSWSTHQVHPTQYPHLHLVLLLWWPSSVLRFISRTPDTQTCNKALEVTQNSNSSSSKQYPANLWPSNCL